MPASFDVHDGLVDVLFSWPNNEITRAQEIIGEAAHYLWTRGEGPIVIVNEETIQKPWGDLSNQEKLRMVFQYTTRSIIEMAKTSKVDTDAGQARDAAIAYANTEYNLKEE